MNLLMLQIPSNLPEIIKEAATSILGIFALLIIVAGIVCIYLFRSSSDKIKLLVWLPIIIGVIMFGVAVSKQTNGGSGGGKTNTNQPGPVTGGSPPPTPEVTVTLEVEENSTLQKAIQNIAKSDGYTVEYKGCERRFLNAVVNGGKMKGKSSADIIEQLQDRLKNRALRMSYTVEAFPERSLYAITCTKN